MNKFNEQKTKIKFDLFVFLSSLNSARISFSLLSLSDVFGIYLTECKVNSTLHPQRNIYFEHGVGETVVGEKYVSPKKFDVTNKRASYNDDPQ